MENNYFLPSANEALGHRSLHYQGESGVYVSPHMYTSIFTLSHKCCSRMVCTGDCCINLQHAVRPSFTRKIMGISMCFLRVIYRLLMCGYSPALVKPLPRSQGSDWLDYGNTLLHMQDRLTLTTKDRQLASLSTSILRGYESLMQTTIR